MNRGTIAVVIWDGAFSILFAAVAVRPAKSVAVTASAAAIISAVWWSKQ